MVFRSLVSGDLCNRLSFHHILTFCTVHHRRCCLHPQALGARIHLSPHKVQSQGSWMEGSKPHWQRMRTRMKMRMRGTHRPAAGMHEPQYPQCSKQRWEEQRYSKWPISGWVPPLPKKLLLHRPEGSFQGSLATRALCWLHIYFPVVPSSCQVPLALCCVCLYSQAERRLKNNERETYGISKHFNVDSKWCLMRFLLWNNFQRWVS